MGGVTAGLPSQALAAAVRCGSGQLTELVEDAFTVDGLTAVVRRPSTSPLGDYVVEAPCSVAGLAALGGTRTVGNRTFVQLSDEVITATMLRAVQPPRLFPGAPAAPMRVALMFSNPNANKALHLGHLRQNALGMGLCRLLRSAGLAPIAVSMNGDWGFHIAQAIVGHFLLPADERERLARGKSDHFAGACIASYYRALRDNPELETLARTVIRGLHAGDGELVALNERLTSWSMQGHKDTYSAIGSGFDLEVFESREISRAVEIIEDGCRRGVFHHREDGSVAIDLTAEGFWDVTLRRGDGTTTAFVQHMSGWDRLYRELAPDLMLFLIGPDWLAPGSAAELMYERLEVPWARQFGTFHHGLVRSHAGRLRSRYGESLTIDAVLERVAERLATWPSLAALLGTRKTSMLAGDFASGLLKYQFLRVPRIKDATFDEDDLWALVAPRFVTIVEALDLAHRQAVPRGHDVPSRGRGCAPLPAVVRSLAFSVDDVPRAACRSLVELDLAFLVRLVDRMANATIACRGVLPAGSPLWGTVANNLTAALEVLSMARPAASTCFEESA